MSLEKRKISRSDALPLRAAAFLEVVRARGNDARDVRDAAHEACHALQAGLEHEPSWDREVVHRALVRATGGRSLLVRAEILARAVEQLACRELGVDAGDVKHWAFLSGMEAIKFGLPFVEPTAATEAILRCMEGEEAAAMVKRVLSLGPASPGRRRRRKSS